MASIKSTYIKKNPVVTKWLKNAMRSIGVSTESALKDIYPNLSEVTSTAAKTTSNALAKLRSGSSDIGKLSETISNNKYIQIANKAYKNALSDLKSGNFNNEDRFTESMFGDDDSFDSDFTFGDEDSDEGGLSINVNNKSSDDAMLKMSNSMDKHTEAIVKTNKASMDAYIATASATMYQLEQLGSQVVTHLENINNNLAAMVQYNNENMTRYIEASMAYYDKVGAKVDSDSSSSYNSKTNATDVFNNKHGGINMSSYKAYVKEQLKKSAGSSILSLIDDDMLEMAASNPLGFATQSIASYMIPKLVGTSIESVEKTFSAFVPTMLNRLADLADDSAITFTGNIKKMIGQTFGLRVSNKKDLTGAKVDRGAIPFDGETKHAVTEIITKELREQTSYLKAIAESKMFKVDTKSARDNSEVFDYNKNDYIKVKDIRHNVLTEINDAILSSFKTSNFGTQLQNLVDNSTMSKKDTDSLQNSIDELIIALTETNKHINPLDQSDNSAYNKIIKRLGSEKGNKRNINVIDKYIRDMATQNTAAFYGLTKSRLDAQQSRNDKLEDIEKNASAYHLQAAGLNNTEDIYKELYSELYSGKRKSVGRKFKAPSFEIDEERSGKGILGRMAKRGSDTANSMMVSVMGGNSKQAFNDFTRMIVDSAKDIGSALSDKVLTPLKATLFGQKNDNGYSEGGLFSGVQNGMKDMLGTLKHTFTGKEWTDSQGNKHGASDNSVLHHLRTMGDTVKKGIMEKLFGPADKKDKEGKGIFKNFTASLQGGLDKWKEAFLGESIEGMDKTEINKKISEKLGSYTKNVTIGGAIGAGVGLFSGSSILGSLVGGPIAGAGLGMAVGILSKSERFQNWLFGEKDEVTGERLGGIISNEQQKYLKENKLSLIGGGAVGAITSGITGKGASILGSIVGGPIAGAAVGIASTMVVKSKTFQDFMFGNEENGRRGLINIIKDSFSRGQAKANNVDDHDVAFTLDDKAMAMSGIGVLGGVMASAILPGGPIGGALIGLGASIVANKKTFKQMLFGEDYVDENGNTKHKHGLFGRVGNMLNANFIRPLRTQLTYFAKDATLELKYTVADAVENVSKTAAEMGGFVANSFKHVFGETGKALNDKILKPAIGALNKAFIEPLAQVTKTATSIIYKVAKNTALFPFRAINMVANLADNGIKRFASWFKNETKIGHAVTRFNKFIRRKVNKFFKTITKGILAPFKLVGKAASWIASGLTAGRNILVNKFNKGKENLSERTGRNLDFFRNKVSGQEGLSDRELKSLRKKMMANERARMKQEYAENKERDRNARLINKATKGQFSSDTLEARAAAIRANPKLAMQLNTKVKSDDQLAEEAKAKIYGRRLVGVGFNAIEKQTFADLSDEGKIAYILKRIYNAIDKESADEQIEQEADKIMEDNPGMDKNKARRLAKKKLKNTEGISDNAKNAIKSKWGFDNDDIKALNDDIKKKQSENPNLSADEAKKQVLAEYSKSEDAGKRSVADQFNLQERSANSTDKDLSNPFAHVTTGKQFISAVKHTFFKNSNERNNRTINETTKELKDKYNSMIEEDIFKQWRERYKYKYPRYKSFREFKLSKEYREIFKEYQKACPFDEWIKDKDGYSKLERARKKIAKNQEKETKLNEDEQAEAAEAIKREKENAKDAVRRKKEREEYAENLSNAADEGSIFKDNNKPKEKKRTDFASFGQIFHDNIGGFGRGSSPIIKRIVHGGFGTDDESKKAKDELDKVKKAGITAEEKKAENEKKSFKDTISSILTSIKVGNKDRKEHKKTWASIFSKKGLITGGLILLAPLIFKGVKWLINTFPNLIKNIGKLIGNIVKIGSDFLGKSVKDIAWTEENNARTNGRSMGEQAGAMMDNVGNSVKQFANGDILEGYQTLSTNDQGEDWAATDKIDKATFRLVGKPTKKIIKTGNKLLNTKIKGDKLKDYLWYGKEYVKEAAQLGKNKLLNTKIKGDKLKDYLWYGKEYAKEGIQNSKVAKFAKSKLNNAKKVGAEATDILKTKAGTMKNRAVDFAKSSASKAKDYLWYGKEYVKEGVQNSKVANFAKSKASNIAEKVGKSKLGTSAKNTISTIAETVGKDDGTFKKILSKIDDFGKMIAEKLGKKLGSKGGKCITDGVKYLKNVAGKFSKKIVSKVGGKLVKGVAAVASFGLSELGGAILGGLNGATAAAKIFAIDSSKVDGTMRLIAAAFGAAYGTTIGSIVDVVIDIVDSATGFNFTRSVATALYKFFAGEKKGKNLDALQTSWQDEYKKYQENEIEKAYNQALEDGTIDAQTTFEQYQQMVENGEVEVKYDSFQDWNSKQNKSFGEKVWDKTKSIAKGAWNGVKKGASAVWSGAKKVGKGIIKTATAPLRSVVGVAKGAWNGAKNTFNALKEGDFGGAATAAFDGITEMAKNAFGAFQDTPFGKIATKAFDTVKNTKFGKIASKAFNGAKEYIRGTFKSIGKGFGKAISGIKSGFKSVAKLGKKAFNGVKSAFKGIGKKISNIFGGIKDKFNDAAESIKNSAVGKAAKKVKDKVKSTAKKAWNGVKNFFTGGSGSGLSNHKPIVNRGGFGVSDAIKNAAIKINTSTGLLQNIDYTKTYSTDDLIKRIAINTDQIVKLFTSSNIGSSVIKTFTSNNSAKERAESDKLRRKLRAATAKMRKAKKMLTGGFGDIPVYSQSDSRWGSDAYNMGQDDATMADTGCGPTAMAMIASGMTGQDVTPPEMASLAEATGDRDETGTNWNFIGKAANAYGVNTTEQVNPSADFIASELSQGKPMILSGVSGGGSGSSDRSPYTKSGHYVVADKIEGNRVRVKNPMNGGSGTYNINEITNGAGAAWSFGGSGKGNKRLRRGGRGSNIISKISSWASQAGEKLINGAFTGNFDTNYDFSDVVEESTTASVVNAADDVNKSISAAGKEIVFIGDSRTVGMGVTMGAKYSSEICQTIGNTTFIAKVGAAFDWLNQTAINNIKKYMSKNKVAILWLGVNGTSGWDNYAKFIKNNLVDNFAHVYYVSVGPTDGSYDQLNDSIKKFNSNLKSVLPSGCSWVDIYDWMKNGLKTGDIKTQDGLHYNAASYTKIYKKILSMIGAGGSGKASIIRRGISRILHGGFGDRDPYTPAGHYVVATGMDSDGNVNIVDPEGGKRSGGYNINSLTNSTGAAFSFGGFGKSVAGPDKYDVKMSEYYKKYKYLEPSNKSQAKELKSFIKKSLNAKNQAEQQKNKALFDTWLEGEHLKYNAVKAKSADPNTAAAAQAAYDAWLKKNGQNKKESIKEQTENDSYQFLDTFDYAGHVGKRLADFNGEAYNYPKNTLSKGQCTWYAEGRAYEKCGWAGLTDQPRGNGGEIYDKAKGNSKYDTGTTIQSNALVSLSSSSSYGHVMFVEYVDRTSNLVYFTEANGNGDDALSSDDGILQVQSLSDWNKRNIKGYVYCGDPEAGYYSNTNSNATVANKKGSTILDTISNFMSEAGSRLVNGAFTGKLDSDYTSFWSSSDDSSSSSSSTSSSSSSDASTTGGSDTASRIWDYMAKKGYSKAAIAGTLGNMEQEMGSDMDYGIYEHGGGTGGGIIQWTPWYDKIGKYSQEKRGDKTAWRKDLDLQLDYLAGDGDYMGKNFKSYSINSGYPSTPYVTLDEFKKSTNYKDATVQFESAIERAGIPAMENRLKFAKKWYDKFGNNVVNASSRGISAVTNAITGGKGSGITKLNPVPITGGRGSGDETNSVISNNNPISYNTQTTTTSTTKKYKKYNTNNFDPSMIQTMIDILTEIATNTQASSNKLDYLKNIDGSTTNIISGNNGSTKTTSGGGYSSGQSRNSKIASLIAAGFQN